MARIPSPDQHRQAWADLPYGERRTILRAINKGRALDDPRDAALAVGAARSQQRFWSKAWLLGPLVSLLSLGQGWAVFAINAIVATGVLGAMSWFWYRRAQQAEELNRQVAEASSGKRRRTPSAGSGRRGSRAEGHTPPKRDHTPHSNRRDGSGPDPNTSRKKLERRKKR